MQDLTPYLTPTNWAALGFLLVLVEIFAPSSLLLWPGLAALVMAAVAALFNLGWQTQFIVFAVLSIICAVIGRRFYAPHRTPTDEPGLNHPAQRYIGQTFTLTSDSQAGHCQLKVGDTIWQARFVDAQTMAKQGDSVKVVAVDDSVLLVELL